jgi:hypothetical protein
MACLHDAVAQRSEADEQRPRKHAQHRVCPLNEDAAPSCWRLRTSEIQPLGRSAPSHDQPRSAIWERVENMFPSDRNAAPPVRDREYEIPRRVDGGDNERVLGAWNRRHYFPAY